MFRIKICGVTKLDDVEAVANAGCDAIGLNFAPISPRRLTFDLARELSRSASGRLLRVGVVMNPTPDELRRLLEEVELDAIQLHGQESPCLLDFCGGLPIIKALTWSGNSAEKQLSAEWRDSAGNQLRAFLIDAIATGAGGGTGRTTNWSLLQPRPNEFVGLPLILAGGLRPSNVAQAIAATACDGVDTASGVESMPGIKDASLVQQFASNARAALK